MSTSLRVSVVGPAAPDAPSPPILVRLVRWSLSVMNAWLWLWSIYHRAVAWRAGAFPGVWAGILLWSSLLLISFLVLVCDPALDGLLLWMLLLVAIYVHMMWKWCTGRALDETRSQSWAGRAEPLFALGLSLVAALADLPPIFFWGYVASLIQIRITRVIGWLDRWNTDRTARIKERVVGTTSWLRRTFFPSQDAVPVPSPATADGQGVVYIHQSRRIGFTAWIARYLVGHAIFSLITGAIGFGLLLKIAGIPFAILLMLIGYEVSPPDYVAEEVETRTERVTGNVRNWLGRSRNAAEERSREWYAEHREEISAKADQLKRGVERKVDEATNAAKREAREAISEAKQEARSAVRDAVWSPFRLW